MSAISLRRSHRLVWWTCGLIRPRKRPEIHAETTNWSQLQQLDGNNGTLRLSRCSIKTNHVVKRWLLGPRPPLKPPHNVSKRDADLAWWEKTLEFVLSYGPEGEPQPLMGSANQSVRLEGSHQNRLKQRRHALILRLVEENTGSALSCSKRERISNSPLRCQ